MIISTIVGLLIGYFAWDYKYPHEDRTCKTVIDIYYPDSISVNKLNLSEVRCPYTLNNCKDCKNYYIADRSGNRYDSKRIVPCNDESCKIYYLSRNDYDETKKWYNAKGLIFNYPRSAVGKIY
jgi:hypothetical protein